MKIRVFTLLMLSIAFSTISAQNNGFGVGLMIGEPTGFSFKTLLTEKNAIDGALALSFANQSAVHIHADYLWQDYNFLKVSDEKIPVYYGLGTRFTFPANDKYNDSFHMGIRIPLGVAVEFAGFSGEFFAEFVPIFELIPIRGIGFNGAFGFKYYL